MSDPTQVRFEEEDQHAEEEVRGMKASQGDGVSASVYARERDAEARAAGGGHRHRPAGSALDDEGSASVEEHLRAAAAAGIGRDGPKDAEADDDDEEFELEDLPLSAVMDEAEMVVNVLDNFSSGDHEEEARLVARGLRLLEHVAERIRTEGVLSSNEELEDIGTGSLRYLMAEFLMASVLQHHNDGPRARQWAVPRALAALESFLDTLRTAAGGEPQKGHALVSAADAAQAHALLERRAEVKARLTASRRAAAAGGAGGAEGTSQELQRMMMMLATGGVGNHPRAQAISRQAKIARWKAEKEDKARLTELRLREARAARALASGEDGVGSMGALVDDEERRDMQMLQLRIAARKAVDDLQSLIQEEALLTAHATGDAEPPVDGPRRYDPMDPARPGIELMRVKPTYEIEREVVKAGVFRPDHRLPTMTPGEAAEIEMRESVARSQRMAEGEQRAPASMKQLRAEGREDDAEAAEAARQKDSHWADWKDDHTRGAGNTKRY